MPARRAGWRPSAATPIGWRRSSARCRQVSDNFDLLILYAYGAYYIDPRVRDIVEARTGYPNRPPQPLGYDLPPFDERLLDKVKQRPPFWRRP